MVFAVPRGAKVSVVPLLGIETAVNKRPATPRHRR